MSEDINVIYPCSSEHVAWFIDGSELNSRLLTDLDHGILSCVYPVSAIHFTSSSSSSSPSQLSWLSPSVNCSCIPSSLVVESKSTLPKLHPWDSRMIALICSWKLNHPNPTPRTFSKQKNGFPWPFVDTPKYPYNKTPLNVDGIDYNGHRRW